ncbi:MAG: 30S ribosomal protein S4e [Nanoarchaeota archaeon]|nr:30S ribosomal protein S4e [Nanoarchaeota archaeon]MBU1644479.1 30S ribosomal protein S4e [Nanoarchaeota archaeon]MBU1976483.1 30S ribosomal protein S4e [Nanoarchaeota archaeon]
MKNHLKRIASPRTWVINRMSNTFITRPKPGAHSLEMGLPLGVVLRDQLKLTTTMGETKKLLNNKEVLVDGKRRKDHRYIVGLFDVLSIPALKDNYRVLVNKKGRLVLKKLDSEESNTKLSKVVGKVVLKGGKTQFNLHDGKNIISTEKAKIGDTFVLSLPKMEVKKILFLKEGVTVFLTKGKHAGHSGILKEIKGREATYSEEGQEVDTAKDYLFVVGKDKAEIKIEN